ncbi:Fe2+-dependent dioxygenase [Alteriqipengyuania lutimaris]|uniref:Fe2+-dependent dioxygenase n=1 Tax=Alteriqipengyuania lutimaris TaxID=1538146 RepID=A0A395LNS2_9SPHN|nr:Fe2+-dependent dioxygenase [Alteriqipengyuania lutimaris]MBB3034878.1 PKHD-type hydroxylase [Alteriqipengyuania lutimaris]RDS76290.1 Fe2+-dependent dioxygenase [Alteriqipengyuania lutimaris]
MILTIAAIESEDDLARIDALVAQLVWRDGARTAGASARAVKQNEQADMTGKAGRELGAMVLSAIEEHPVVRAAARPRRMSNILVSKTRDGGHYGPHVDNAMMRKGAAKLRSDISFTLFLAPPDTYEGGELTIHSAGSTQSVKGERGQLVLYPSSSIHEVRPVTSGERIVCVGWIESLLPDPSQRELLFDLENLRTTMRRSLPANSAEMLTLDKSIANLLRMWASV